MSYFFRSQKPVLVITSFIVTSIILGIVFMFIGPTQVSALEHMKYSNQERLDLAKYNYDIFKEKPNEKSEVLISFNKNISQYDVPELIPSDCKVIAEFHSFSVNDRTITGKYVNNDGKDILEVQDAYFDEIYQLVVNRKNKLEKKIRNLEEEKAEIKFDLDALNLQTVSTTSDVSDMNADKDVAENGKPIQENDKISVPDRQEEYAEYIAEIEKEISAMQKCLKNLILQKESMDKGEFNITGVRILDKNSEIYELTQKSQVKAIEILDFDNNNLIKPIIED